MVKDMTISKLANMRTFAILVLIMGTKYAIANEVTLEHVYWVRDCIDDRQVNEVLGIEVGCEHKHGNTMGTGGYVCVCKEEGCNKKMNEISTTILKGTTTPKVTDMMCYYCHSQILDHELCNSEEFGELIKCQMNDEEEPHYGNACIVGHSDPVIHGIINGSLQSDVEIIGSCSGKESSSFKCKGMNNFIKWDINLENLDFKIESEFNVDQATTPVVFVLWSGNRKFMTQVSSQTNLDLNEFQTIVVKRAGNSLKIDLDGTQLKDTNLEASIDAVGWRPLRNTIYIKSLKLDYVKLPVTVEEQATTVEPTTIKRSNPTQELRTTNDPTTTEEPTLTEEPTTVEEQATTVEPTTIKKSNSTQELTTTNDLTTNKEPTITEEPTTAEEQATTVEPTTTKKSNPTQELTATNDLTTTEEPTITEEPTTAEEQATTVETTTIKKSNPTQELTTTNESTTAGELISTEEHTTTENQAKTTAQKEDFPAETVKDFGDIFLMYMDIIGGMKLVDQLLLLTHIFI